MVDHDSRQDKLFTVKTYLETNNSKLCKQNFAESLPKIIIYLKANFIVVYTNFKAKGQYTTSTRRQNIQDMAVI